MKARIGDRVYIDAGWLAAHKKRSYAGAMTVQSVFESTLVVVPLYRTELMAALLPTEPLEVPHDRVWSPVAEMHA